MWRWVWNMAWWHTWAVKQRQVWTVEQRTRSCRVSFHGHSRRGMGGHLEYKMAVTITGSTKVRPRTSGTTRLGETTRLGTLGRWHGSLDGRRLWRGGLDLRRFWCGGQYEIICNSHSKQGTAQQQGIVNIWLEPEQHSQASSSFTSHLSNSEHCLTMPHH